MNWISDAAQWVWDEVGQFESENVGKSLEERKEDAKNRHLDTLRDLLWGLTNLDAKQIDEVMATGPEKFRNTLSGKDSATFARFWEMFPKRFAKGTSWDSFVLLVEDIENLIEVGEGLNAGSSEGELFDFLSGGVLADSLFGDSVVYDGQDFADTSMFADRYDEYIEGPPAEETSPRSIPEAVGEPIPPVVEPEIGGGAQVLPPEGPVGVHPIEGAWDANIPTVPGSPVPPSDGTAPAPAPGKSAGFVGYLDALISNDFFKQAGWEITHDHLGNPLPPGTTLGQHLDDNPELDDSYFLGLARQAKNWDTFRYKEAELFGQTDAELSRTLEDKVKEVRKALSNFGVNLDEVDEATIARIARNAYIMGWTAENGELDQALYDNAELAITNMAKGDHANTVHLLRGKAQLYMLNIDDATLDHYAQQINTGMATLGGITQGFAEMARSEYPALKEIMDKGFLPGTYFGSFQTAATNLLERPVKFFGDDRNMFDVIAKGVPDEETGFRPMTIPEAQTYIRSLPEWENTKNARQRGRSVVENIMNKWGAVSSNYGIKAPQRSSY